MRGEESGVEISRPLAFRWTFDANGQILHEQQYLDWDEALAAVASAG